MDENEAWLDAFKPVPISDYLDRTVEKFAHRPAIDFFGKGWTYGELGALVERAAAGFQQIGVKKGVHVGLCLPNSPYYCICYFAILKIGGTIVNYNPLYVERELAFQVKDSQTKIMVTLDLKIIYDKVEQVRQDGLLEKIVVCPMADILPQPKKLLFQIFKGRDRASITYDANHLSYREMMEGSASPEPVTIDPETNIAVLQYTGGTTGVPKGAMLTHRNLSANIEQMRHFFRSARPGEERKLCILPFFHVFAMTVGQNLSVLIGAEMVLLPRFELKQLLQTVVRKKVTLFPGVPTIYTAINNSPLTKQFDLSSIRLCLSGGAPLPIEVKQQFETLTSCRLVEGYGLTESSPVAACNPLEGDQIAGSIGRPMIGTIFEFRDLEDLSKQVPKGEKGELCIRGPQVMAGYWQRPDATADTIEDGVLHTGDVGYQDENGFTYLVDRIKDLILCSGYNVYPRVIEEALYQHPDIEEAIVIAVPDDYRGQAPKAFVKMLEGKTAGSEDIREFLKDYLSAIEMPREVEFRTELPKTMVGKLSKKELVEEERAKRERAGQSA